MAVNYVKFQRGTLAAYESLKAANRLDENTLYFIYPEGNEIVGSLYMGERIISGGDIVLESSYLDDLKDVVATGAGTNSFLVKDGENWVAKSLDEVISLIANNDSFVKFDDQQFEKNNNKELSLKGFANAAGGTLLTKDKNGQLVWAQPNIEEVENLKTTISNLQSVVSEKVDKVYFTIEKEDGTTAQVEGSLLSPVDKEKLNALVLDENGSIGISGTVNASKVEGLGEWVTINGPTYISNLTENNLSSVLIDKINFITSADNDVFEVKDGKLGLLSIVKTAITDVISGKFNNFISSVNEEVFKVENKKLELINVPAEALYSTVGNIDDIIEHIDGKTLVDEINMLKEQMIWTEMV